MATPLADQGEKSTLVADTRLHPALAAGPVPEPDAAFLATLSVLFVDDDEAARETLGGFLGARVGRLIVAADGEEGLRVFRAERPMLVVTDLLMPGMDGLALVEELRRIDPFIQVVVHSSAEFASFLDRALHIGVDQYVSKPFDPARLHAALVACAHRLRIEAVAREQERHDALVAALDLLPIGVSVVEAGADGRYRRIAHNGFLGRVIGEELQADPQLDLFASRTFLADRRTPVATADLPGPEAARTGASVRDRDLHLLRRDGSWRVVSASAAPIPRAEPGAPRRSVTVLLDVTEQREAQQVVQSSEAYLRAVLDTSLDAFWAVDGAGRLVDVNPAACALTGYGREELLALDFSQVPGDPQAFDSRSLRIREAGWDRFESHFRRKDGRLVPVEVCARSLPTPLGGGLVTPQGGGLDTQPTGGRLPTWGLVVAFVRDVSARHKLEAELEEKRQSLEELVQQRTRELQGSQAQFLSAFEHAPTGMALATLKGGFLSANPALCRLLDYTLAELQAKTIRDITHHDDLAPSLEAVRAMLAGEVRSSQTEKRYVGRSGRVVWSFTTVSLVRDGEGRPLHFLAQIEDATERKAAEVALRESEERYRRIAEGLSDYLYSVRVEAGRPAETIHGPACLAVTGYTPEEFRRDPQLWIGIVPEAERRLVVEQCQSFLAGRNIPPIEHHIARKDGSVRWVQDTLIARRDAGGVFVSYDGVVKDITERKNAEEELRRLNAELEERVRLRTEELTRQYELLKVQSDELREAKSEFEAIFNSTLEGMFLMDSASGRFLRCNPACARLLGVGEANFLGLSIADIHPPEELPVIFEHIRRFLDVGDGAPREIRFRRADGSLFPAELTPTRVAVAGKPCFLLTFRDLSAAKRAEAATREARAAAENANNAKSSFLANMSHELRTPMNAILGFAQLLLRHPNCAPEQRKQVGMILRSGEQLLALITDILDYSKVEAGRFVVAESTFELHGLLDELEQKFRLPAEAKRLRLLIELQSSEPRFVVADEGKLRQVLQNLLSNAVKFTERGGVSLRAAVAQAPGAPAGLRLVVEVEDSGPGVSPEEMGLLFQIFGQTDSGRKSKSGTGLGLAISRRFAELLGGTLTARSQVGQGCTFRLELPIREGAEASLERPAKARRVAALAAGQPGFRVLVADDKEDNRALLEAMLGSVGFQVRSVENGAEAVRDSVGWRPQLVLMDLRMPVLSGAEAMARIRALPGGEAVKIIAISASAFDDDREKALAAGADAFLAKPFREEVLFEKIAGLLGVRYRFAGASESRLPAVAAPSFDVLRTGLAALPDELVARLRKAAQGADRDRLVEFSQEAEAHSSELSRELCRLAGGFAYDQVLALLGQEPGSGPEKT